MSARGQNEAELSALLIAPNRDLAQQFLATIPQYPFQEGGSLNAAGINYNSLKAAQAMKRLQEIETMSAPSN